MVGGIDITFRPTGPFHCGSNFIVLGMQPYLFRKNTIEECPSATNQPIFPPLDGISCGLGFARNGSDLGRQGSPLVV